jgi:hypothetical protein
MRALYGLSAAVLLAAGSAAFGMELTTEREASVYAKPDRTSEVLVTVPAFTKLSSEEQKDFWYRVTVKHGGRTVRGWVRHTDVQAQMGRSKGQLLAQNKRLFEAVGRLRKEKSELAARLRESQEELALFRAKARALASTVTELKAELERVRAKQEKPGGAGKAEAGG